MADFELDPATLSLLSSLNDIPTPGYITLIKSVFGILTRNPSQLGAPSLPDTSPDATQAHGGLLMVVTECAQAHASPDQLQQILDDAGVSDDKVSLTTKAYEEYLGTIRECLMNTGMFGERKMVGFDWRLDYRVRSSGAGENTSVFLCRFRLMSNDGVESFEEMECSLSGMKDLLYKLNQATKAGGIGQEDGTKKKKKK